MNFYRAEKLLEVLVRAYFKDRDMETVLACVTDDVKWIGPEDADCVSGKAALHTMLESDLKTYPNTFGVEMQSPSVQTISSDAVIFTVIGKLKDIPGIATGLTVRGTIVCVRTDKGWLASNIHTSAPSVEGERLSLQNELASEKEKLSALLRGVPGGVAIYRLKKDGRIPTEYVSDGLAKICGYHDGKDFMTVMAYDSRKLVLPEDYPVVAAACRESIEKDVPTNVNYRVFGKDGRPVHISLNSVVIKNAKLASDDIAVFYAVQSLVSDEVLRSKAEQDYYRRILNITKTAYFEVDEAGNFYASDYFSQYKVSDYGLSAIMGGERASACFYPADLSKVKEYLHKVNQRGDFGSVSARLLMKDGSYQWTEITAHMEYDGTHHAKRMTGILRDVSPEWEKQKARLEKELYDNNRIAETLMASIPGGVAVYRVKKNGKVGTDYVSESLAKMCGYTAEEFLAYLRDDSIINIVPEDIPAVQNALRVALENHKPLSIMYRIFKKDRTELLIRLDANTIHAENRHEDDVAVIYAVHTPVSDASKKIIDEQAMLKKLVDEVPVGLGIYDLTDKTFDQTYMNEAFYMMLGTKRDARIEYSRENALLSTHPDDAAVLRGAIQALRSGKDTAEITYRVKDAGDGWFWIHLTAHVVERKDGHIHAYAAFSDYNQTKATEQKNLQEQLRFRTVAEEMNAAVFEWNMEDNSFYSSPAYQKYEASRVDMSTVMNNRGPGNTVHPEDLDKLRQFFVDSESGAPRAEATLRLKLIDGSYRWCRMVGLFYQDETGKLTKKVGIFIDVNDEHEKSISLQELLDEIPGGLGKYDYYDGVLELTHMNDAYFTMLGIRRDTCRQYAGVNTMEAVYPDDREHTIHILNELATGKQSADIYQRVTDGKGGWFWMKLVISVTGRENGHTLMIASISNCDELIRSQEALRTRYEDQVRFAKMVASNAVASSMVNLTQQTISMQSAEADGIMEIITSQTPQQGFAAMYPCIPDEEIREEYAKIFNVDRIIEDFAKGIERKRIRHPFMNYDCWYESTYNAVRNPKTNDLEVYCVARDVSKDVQDEFVNQQIMAKSYDEVILIDPETGEPQPLVENTGSDIYEEQRRLGDYNLGLQRFIMRHCTDEHPEQVADALSLQAVKAALQKQDSYTVTYSLYNQRHELVRRSASYSYLNKYRRKLLCVIQDITSAFEKETRQREALHAALTEAQSSSRAKADFYSRMSHDMRTPMNGILGMAELSRDETDVATLKTNIQKIHESGEYLLSLINDTLDIQRIESGKLPIEPQIVSTREVVGNILDMVRASADAKGVTLKYSAGNTDLNWYIRADAVRLKQVFVNLLSNAVKFTPPGGTVELEFQLLSRDGMISHDVIYVRDTGIGMSEEFLKNGIFEPFSQESNQITANYAGSGLGLSIAKRLVELMNGRIEVESKLGVGTTFAVYLDFERVSSEEATRSGMSQKESMGEISEVLRGKKILLAEDQPLNAEITRKLLKKVGCEAEWVKNGQEAIDCFANAQDYSFDAILMDIRMPVMDGLEAARTIRAMRKADAQGIPIVAMTANTYAEDVRASLEAGMNAHLGKPIVPKLLYEKLAECISAKQSKAQRH